MTRSPLSIEDAQALAATFLADRHAKHGTFRMEDDGAGDGGNDSGNDSGAGTDAPAEKTPEEKLADALAEVETWKANSRKHEDRAKANKKAADELASLKAANATPDEQLAEAQRVAAEATRSLARYKVAAETGIPADLITGDDEDAMRSFAEALKAFRGEQPTPKTGPKPDPSQGPKAPVKKSASEIARADYERRHPRKN